MGIEQGQEMLLSLFIYENEAVNSKISRQVTLRILELAWLVARRAAARQYALRLRI